MKNIAIWDYTTEKTVFRGEARDAMCFSAFSDCEVQSIEIDRSTAATLTLSIDTAEDGLSPEDWEESED